MRKISLFISLILVFILSACGNNEESIDVKSDNKESAAETSLVVSGDVVEEKAGCVLKSQFTEGDLIVWRVEVKNPKTMKQAPEDTKVQVHLSTGEVLDMNYGPHPSGENQAKEDVPHFWTAAMPVTEDTPTGVLEYHVTAENENKSGEFHPFDVAPSLLTVNPPEESGE